MIEPGPRGLPPVESSRPTLVGERWMAVTGHPLTAQVAARVLERGGTAIDAGVAAGLATNVVQVDMCNLGGIAPILVRPAGSAEVFSVAGVGRWSETASVDGYLARHGTSMDGCASCIVPGALGAWLSALERFGTWTFGQVAEPAIELAAEGFVLDAVVATGLDLFAWAYERWPSSAEVFCPGGRHMRTGDRLVQSDLARLLRRMVEAEDDALAASPTEASSLERRRRGLEAVRRAFYEGETAQAMVDFVTAEGGFLTLEDLAGFRAEAAPAPARRFEGFGGVTVHVPPAEWSQGPALLQALGVLERFDLGRLGHNTAPYLHVVLDTVKLCFAERERYFGDAGPVDLGRLLSSDHLDRLAGLLRKDGVLPDLETVRHPADDVPSTTQVTVVDARGNAFATAPSDTLAMSPVVPGLGIAVSGRGVQSRTDPTHPAALGPRRRPRVTPAPAIVTDDADGLWAITCPGGDVILQAILQTFLNVAVFEMTEQQAVEAPRAVSMAFPNSFHPHQHLRGTIVAENRIPDEVLQSLAELGHEVRSWPPFEFEAGSVALIRSRDGEPGGSPAIWAGADPRRAAYALGR